MLMAPIGLKTRVSARGKPIIALHESAILPRLFLTFGGRRGLTPHSSERRSFRPADRPQRPEVNARQRDAPSGAKVFGVSLPRVPETRARQGKVSSPAKAGDPVSPGDVSIAPRSLGILDTPLSRGMTATN